MRSTALVLLLQVPVNIDRMALHLPPSIGYYVLEFIAVLAKHVPPPLYQNLNVASITAFGYLIYYMVLDVGAGAMISPLWTGSYLAATYLAFQVPHGVSIAIGIFFAGWIAQFWGHGVHERRAPALLDNLLGAVVLAPLFVFFEVLFHFGYRPELQKWLKNETGRLVTQFRKQDAARERNAAKAT